MSTTPPGFFIAAATLLALTAGAASGEDGRYIVLSTVGQSHAADVTRAAGGEVIIEIHGTNAVAALLPEAALRALQSIRSLTVEDDPRRYPLAQTQPYGIGSVQADQVVNGGGAVTVCIIDSGYDLGHEDLPVSGVTFAPDGGAGTADEDGCGHGTHVAGTVAAVDNALGVIGVDPEVGLHIVRVFDDACQWTYASDLIDAANLCRDAGANVISMSLGSFFASMVEENAFNDLYTNSGILSVAAAGNDGNTQYSYPASYDSVVSVAAVDNENNVADFSQKNDQVELAAPGVGVLSTVPTGTGRSDSLTVDGSTYEAIAMEGTPDASGTGPLVDCGLGTSACPGGGGQACLISRGDITFADKVLNCQAGGGVAAVIYNNVSGALHGTLGTTVTSIPSAGITQSDGLHLLNNELGSSTTLTTQDGGNYDFFDGTSMATPHVSGVAALVWSQDMSWTNVQIRDALDATALDLGDAGRDNAYGYGLVQAKAALDHLMAGPVNNPPTASFTWNCTELSCDFTDTSSDSDGTIVAWSWDFGDGNNSTQQHPSHSYGSGGAYNVTLTASDDDAASDPVSHDVSVCAADLLVSNVTYDENALVQASNSITTGADVVVTAGADVSFRAGNYVALGNGFSVAGSFTATIGSCP